LAALATGALAQDKFTQPPLNQPDVETAAQNINEAPPAEQAQAQAEAQTPRSSDVSATAPETNISDANAPAPQDTAVNPLPSQTSVSETTTTTADAAPAQTPAAEPASATVSTSMAYATNIANAPGGVFKPKNLGNYPMSHYASPSRPLPYDQVDAYLKASKSQQLAQNWWGNDQLASAEPAPAAATPSSSDVSASVPSQASGTAGLPGDTDVRLNDETTPAATPSPAPSSTDPTAIASPPPDQTPAE
jgi:hypothetical protein